MVTNERDPACEPTPRQFVDEWEAATDEQRLYRAERIIDNARAASKCFVMDHDGLQDTLNRLRDLRVEDYAKLDEAYGRAHRAEDKVAELRRILMQGGQNAETVRRQAIAALEGDQ